MNTANLVSILRDYKIDEENIEGIVAELQELENQSVNNWLECNGSSREKHLDDYGYGWYVKDYQELQTDWMLEEIRARKLLDMARNKLKQGE